MDWSHDFPFQSFDGDQFSVLDDFLNSSEKPLWNFRTDLPDTEGKLDYFDPTKIDDPNANAIPNPISCKAGSGGYAEPDESKSVVKSLFSAPSLVTQTLPLENPRSSVSLPIESSSVLSPYHAASSEYITTNMSESSKNMTSQDETNLDDQCFTSSCTESQLSAGVNVYCDIENSNVTDRSDYNGSDGENSQKDFTKPPTTAGITLDDLKEVFDLERPKAEKHLNLKRTTFSNLSRHFGISKWPYRTIRDVRNRQKANDDILQRGNISKEKRRKLLEQQRNLEDVIELIYSDPTESRDSNTLAVLLKIVESRRKGARFA